jgi:signal transduction histidine kinase
VSHETDQDFPLSARRLAMVLGLLGVLAVVLTLWTVREARLQKREIERALQSEVSVVARSLVPALAAASSSARELKELVGWKLLDNARLLGRLQQESPMSGERLDRLGEENGLDAIAVLDSGCRVVQRTGDPYRVNLDREDLLAVCSGKVQEYVFDWPEEGTHGLVAVAVSIPEGGAVVVGTEASVAFAFAGRLGVSNLLQATAGTGNVLYLSYLENLDGSITEASWDGGPVPSRAVPGLRDRSVFEVEVPVEGPAGSGGILRVGLDRAPLARATAGAARRTALVSLALVALVLATSALALVIRARSAERVESMQRLGELERQRSRSERLASAGELSAGVAHEIRNPLNAISIAAQRIRRQKSGADYYRFADTILAEVTHMEEILKGFLDLARPARGERERFDLTETTADVVRLLEGEGAENGIHLTLVRDEQGIRVHGDPACLRRAVVNLIRNAIQVSPRESVVEVVLAAIGDKVRLTVRDRGHGMEEDVRERAFDPFFTTRAEGSGLGLPLVRRVAEEHGGWAQLLDRKGGGVDAIMEISRGHKQAEAAGAGGTA